jgi:hypothetical protein
MVDMVQYHRQKAKSSKSSFVCFCIWPLQVVIVRPGFGVGVGGGGAEDGAFDASFSYDGSAVTVPLVVR